MTSRGLLVLGMHRSGTSAMTGALSRLGVRLSGDLMPGDQHNEAGYWESRQVNSLMEQLLHAAASRWHDWRPLDLSGVPADVIEAIGEKIRLYIDSYGSGAPLFGVKDPRICRALPFWIDIFEKCGREPVAVIIVRHPLAVARSLAKRDGMPQDKGLLLWLRHLLDAERDSRSIRRVFVQYHDLLLDWRSVAAQIATSLALEWPTPIESAVVDVEEFLRPALRHWTAQDAELEAIAGASWFSELWSLLSACCNDQQRRDEAFDRIAAEFLAAARPFQSYFGGVETSLELAQHQAAVTAAALDKARWLIGGSILGSGEPGGLTVELARQNYTKELAELAQRVERLESALRQWRGREAGEDA